MLQYYYGLQHKREFERIFGKYHIGQHPEKLLDENIASDYGKIQRSQVYLVRQRAGGQPALRELAMLRASGGCAPAGM